MANDEHVRLLKQGVAAWSVWRDENPDIRPDLSGANLRGRTSAGQTSSGQTSAGRTSAGRNSTRRAPRRLHLELAALHAGGPRRAGRRWSDRVDVLKERGLLYKADGVQGAIRKRAGLKEADLR